MPYIISEPDEIKADVETPSLSQKSSGFIIEEPVSSEEPVDSRRLGAGSIASFLSSFPGVAQRLLGGDPEGLINQSQSAPYWDRVYKYDQQKESLKNSGLTDEAIEDRLGNRPPEPITDLSEGLFNLFGGESLKPKNSIERIAQGVAKDIGDFLAFQAILPGGKQAKNFFESAKTGALFGAGSEVAGELGASPLTQFFSGVGVAGGKGLSKLVKSGIDGIVDLGKSLLKYRGVPSGSPKFLEESLTPSSLADLELSSKDLSGRIAKTSSEELNKFNNLVNKNSEPIFENTGTFRARDIDNEIRKSNINFLLDNIYKTKETHKKNWENIVSLIEDRHKSAKEAYRSLYEIAEVDGSKIDIVPNELFNKAKELKKEMGGSLISVSEESGLKTTAENLVKKLIPSQEKNAKRLFEDLKAEGIVADFESILSMMNKLALEGSPRKVKADVLMKTKRSVNRILSKSDIIPAPVDLLKPISAAIKTDLYQGLEPFPSVQDIYTSAEEMFAKTKQSFDNNAILKLRKTETPEELTALFTKPSNVERLFNVIGKDINAKSAVERMIVEEIASKSTEEARKMAGEFKEYLSDKSQKSLNKLIELKDSKTPLGSQEIVRSNLLNDIQKSLTEGSRPKYALDLMKNQTGYHLVKNSLNTSKNGKSIFKNLQRMTIEDMIDSIIDKDSKNIDFKKAKDIFSSPNLKRVIREYGGDEMVKFFENLESIGNNFYKNLEKLKGKDPSLFYKYLDMYLGTKLKHAIALFLPKVGVPLLMGGEGIKIIQRRTLFKIIENSEGREILKKLGKPNSSPDQTLQKIKSLGQFYYKINDDEKL